MPNIPPTRIRERYVVHTEEILDNSDEELLSQVELIEKCAEADPQCDTPQKVLKSLIKKPPSVVAKNRFREPLPTEQLDDMKRYRFVLFSVKFGRVW